jgi:hypothetical protein
MYIYSYFLELNKSQSLFKNKIITQMCRWRNCLSRGRDRWLIHIFYSGWPCRNLYGNSRAESCAEVPYKVSGPWGAFWNTVILCVPPTQYQCTLRGIHFFSHNKTQRFSRTAKLLSIRLWTILHDNRRNSSCSQVWCYWRGVSLLRLLQTPDSLVSLPSRAQGAAAPRQNFQQSKLGNSSDFWP